MRIRGRAALLLVLAACGGKPATAPAERCASTPSFEVEVKPILERRCFACHAGSGPAVEEHDFSRFDTLRAQRSSVADNVAARAMPPAGKPQLTDAEAQTLIGWARCGG